MAAKGLNVFQGVGDIAIKTPEHWITAIIGSARFAKSTLLALSTACAIWCQRPGPRAG